MKTIAKRSIRLAPGGLILVKLLKWQCGYIVEYCGSWQYFDSPYKAWREYSKIGVRG